MLSEMKPVEYRNYAISERTRKDLNSKRHEETGRKHG